MSEQDIQTAARALLDAGLTGSGDEARHWAAIAVSSLTAENERLRKERDEARRLIERVLKRHATINTLCDADRYELGRALAALPPTPPATEGSDDTA